MAEQNMFSRQQQLLMQFSYKMPFVYILVNTFVIRCSSELNGKYLDQR
jgi:hypothetical protein